MKESREVKVIKEIRGYRIYEVTSDLNFPTRLGIYTIANLLKKQKRL